MSTGRLSRRRRLISGPEIIIATAAQTLGLVIEWLIRSRWCWAARTAGNCISAGRLTRAPSGSELHRLDRTRRAAAAAPARFGATVMKLLAYQLDGRANGISPARAAHHAGSADSKLTPEPGFDGTSGMAPGTGPRPLLKDHLRRNWTKPAESVNVDRTGAAPSLYWQRHDLRIYMPSWS